MKWILPALAAFSLTACGGLSRQMNEAKDPERCLVYGYIDVDAGPCDMDEFAIRQVLPKAENGEEIGYYFRIDHGAIYAEYVKPGSFQLALLRGWGWFPRGNIRYTIGFPKQAEGFRIEKPGLYYIGSFKITDLGKSKYEIELCEKPTEREVLEKILRRADGTSWDARIRQRLEELK